MLGQNLIHACKASSHTMLTRHTKYLTSWNKWSLEALATYSMLISPAYCVSHTSGTQSQRFSVIYLRIWSFSQVQTDICWVTSGFCIPITICVSHIISEFLLVLLYRKSNFSSVPNANDKPITQVNKVYWRKVKQFSILTCVTIQGCQYS